MNKAKCIIAQYGNYSIPELDLRLNGINTQGENIADNGGIKEAYRAYSKYIQWNLDLRKILGVDKIFLKSRFFLLQTREEIPNDS